MINALRKLFMRGKSSHFTPLYFLTLKAKRRLKSVKVFHKYIYRVITLLPTCYKTYCFAFQKRLFCTVKA